MLDNFFSSYFIQLNDESWLSSVHYSHFAVRKCGYGRFNHTNNPHCFTRRRYQSSLCRLFRGNYFDQAANN